MFNLPYNKFQKTLEIVTFILLLAQIVYTAVLYPQLPSKIPSHFNLEGQCSFQDCGMCRSKLQIKTKV